MFRNYFLFGILILPVLTLQAQKKNDFKGYRFNIDLIHVNNDKIKVEMMAPPLRAKSIVYHLPKIVPGTYSEDDYGRYIEQFKAFDRKGDTLPVVKTDPNSWSISHADRLFRITYWVNDTFDDALGIPAIFEPAGSNIQKDTVYVINNHCFLGYFDGMKNIPYELTINHPPAMYGSTALIDLDKTAGTDKFMTSSFNQIVDNPLLYDIPDTTMIKVGKSLVLISVYSPNKLITSKYVSEKLDTLLKAQIKYFGGKLPVEKYAFIIFLDDKPGLSGSEGALEHSYSSFYYFGERDSAALSQIIVDNAAHEFFHIITPLSIHSDKIQFFDFTNPKMSEHLWLYEGSTEYHAHMVQEKYRLISPDELLSTLSAMITKSKNLYNDTVPFTAMSRGVLGKYKDQFGNVYQKGALIAMCIDIKLLQLSNGRYGFMNLIQDLSVKYGLQRGFRDEDLFDEIGKLTYPDIEKFLKTYVSGNQPLPLQEVFNSVGVDFFPSFETKDSAFNMGHFGFGFNPETRRLTITEVANMNSFGKSMGYRLGDEIISINGVAINDTTANLFFKNFRTSSKSGDDLIVKVLRNQEDGKVDTVDLKGKLQKMPVIKYNVLRFSETATAQQLTLREYWLKPNGIELN